MPNLRSRFSWALTWHLSRSTSVICPMEPSPGGEFGHEFRSGRHIFQQLEFAACLAVFSVMDGDGGWKTHETCGFHQQIVLCGGRMRISRGIFPASVLGDSMVASFARNETGSVILLLQPSRVDDHICRPIPNACWWNPQWYPASVGAIPHIAKSPSASVA